jgi:hypothetical protein
MRKEFEARPSVKLEDIARELAEKANECCCRSDGYEEKMRDAILFALRETAQAAAAAEREKCLAAIDAHIAKGPLPGNGCDETAQRNGMVLAYNILCEDEFSGRARMEITGDAECRVISLDDAIRRRGEG